MSLAREASLVERAQAARGGVVACLELAKVIEAGAVEGLAPTRLGVLSTFTSDPLRPYLVVEGAARGMHLQLHFAPFNQLELQAFAADGPLYRERPDVLVIAARLEEASPELGRGFLALRSEGVSRRLDELSGRMRALLLGIRERTAAPVLVWNFAPPLHLSAGLADPAARPAQASVVQHANDRLAEIADAIPDAYVADYARLVVEHGLTRMTDRRLWYRARLPYGTEGLMAVAAFIARYVAAVRRPPRKCLVVDLDETLWGGVLGEDGPGGIRIGEDHPGSVYKAFQQYLLGLRERGVLLAIASKNDRSDALQILEHHPDCVLRPQHFSAIEIGWDDKATSLNRIARQLSIGVDAVAFADDNPAERAWVRSQLPEVAVIDLPADPLGFVDAIETSGVFDILRLTQEDRQRVTMYREDHERRQLLVAAPSMEAFLRDLQMSAAIGPVDEATLPRVVQLLAKTNQFNMTTRRYSGAEVQALLSNGAIALWIRSRDRFGDAGLVGVAIAVPEVDARTWRLDVLLLSCRVIGRGVEDTLVAELARRLRARGAERLLGEFIRTAKNEPAAGFFKRAGFESLDAEGRHWARDLGDGGPATAPHIDVTIGQ